MLNEIIKIIYIINKESWSFIKMERIAHIMGKWGGGVESVVMNYYRNMDRTKVQFDFLCDEDSRNIPYEEIKNLGGRIIMIPPYQNIFKYKKKLRKILEIIHAKFTISDGKWVILVMEN